MLRYLRHPSYEVMYMKAYRAVGTMVLGDVLKTKQKFTWEVVAANEDEARHHVYAEIGSKYRLPRPRINIEEIKEITLEEATNPKVIFKLKKGNE